MTTLKVKISDRIKGELALGLTPKVLDRIISNAVGAAFRRYRPIIDAQAASDANVPLGIIQKRGKEFLRNSRRGKKARYSLSYLAMALPASALSPEQSNGGVSLRGGRFINSAFINAASRDLKNRGGDKTPMVFKRQSGARYPIHEQRIRLYGPLFHAIEQQKEEIERFVVEEIERELLRRAKSL